MCAGVTTFGLPSTSAKCRFMFGNFLTPCTIAQPSRWVKEILPPRLRLSWLLTTVRLSISSLAGTARTLVAVGTSSETDMFLHDGGRGAAQHLHLVVLGRRRGGRFGRCRRRGDGRERGGWPRQRRAGAGAGCADGVRGRCCGGRRRRGGSAVARRRLARGGGGPVDAVQGGSRPGIHASSGRPRRGRRGTCDTSPRPAIRFGRRVKLYCSQQLLASIPLLRRRSSSAPAILGARVAAPDLTCGGSLKTPPLIKANLLRAIRQRRRRTASAARTAFRRVRQLRAAAS